MTIVGIAKQLRDLDAKHQDDGDGGYALLAALRRYRHRLSDDAERLLRDELIRLIEQEDATLRGVALEALVQEWGSDVAQQIATALGRSHPTSEWKGQLLFALLRLGYSSIEEQAVEYISEKLLAGDRSILPMAAALARINKTQCLLITAMAIVNEITRGNADKLEGYVPAIFRSFVEVDLYMVPRLVQAVGKKDVYASQVLTSMLLGYLSRDYVQEEVGGSTIDQLWELLAGEGGGVNES